MHGTCIKIKEKYKLSSWGCCTNLCHTTSQKSEDLNYNCNCLSGLPDFGCNNFYSSL
jgi:hypothetical protein